MTTICRVSCGLFWDALSHCKAPVYLSDNKALDLRCIPQQQKNSILPGTAELELCFEDRQDYIRFILAYVLDGRTCE